MLYMGNIHGNCINVDRLERDGATYRGEAEADFLSADDAWFMPVAQKVGPDGCLYVLDWYDRYHCYQDARRDAAGVDRSKGRLYRVRYVGDGAGDATPRATRFDLAAESDDGLIERLGDANVFFRRTAERLLCERDTAPARAVLETLVRDERASRKQRIHALWAMVGTGRLSPELHLALCEHPDSTFRAWAVRAAGNFVDVGKPLRERIAELAADPSPDVRLQVAIAAHKVEGLDPLAVLVAVLAASRDSEPPIAQVVWQNLHSLLEPRGDAFLAALATDGVDLARSTALAEVVARAVDRVLAVEEPRYGLAVGLLRALWTADRHREASATLGRLCRRVRTRQIDAKQLAALRVELAPLLADVSKGDGASDRYVEAALLAAAWGDPNGITTARVVLSAADADPMRRTAALDALAVAGFVAARRPGGRDPGGPCDASPARARDVRSARRCQRTPSRGGRSGAVPRAAGGARAGGDRAAAAAGELACGSARRGRGRPGGAGRAEPAPGPRARVVGGRGTAREGRGDLGSRARGAAGRTASRSSRTFAGCCGRGTAIRSRGARCSKRRARSATASTAPGRTSVPT